MSYRRIGDFIRLIDDRNSDLAVTNLLGINISKNFMPSVANTNGVDLSKYKKIKKNQFATNVMHVGRDERLPISLYLADEPAIVSPAYFTFEVVDESELLPEYLMLQFIRPEFDRLTWYYCDSSIRGGLEWSRFCEIEIPVPEINQQIKYVSIYKELLKNQSIYKNSLGDLQLICNGYMDRLKRTEEFTALGRLVSLVDRRNTLLSVTKLRGINVDKTFMPSKANVDETDLSKYKIVQKGEFAFSPMQVGRDETVRVVLYSDNDPAIISPAYSVFKVVDESILLPEFLMLWFYRPEFNRYGWFISDSSVRASLEWNRFMEINIPIPAMTEQKAIVEIFHALEARKILNITLKEQINKICPILVKGVSGDIARKTANN
ncbi:restriction endonuclease subunit S [Polynucleobacter antarcticus]|uniref:restriction endonuclease subunit S n=1 Tax=Polynucleobacter antarcticus TaxID=1743162 RepID=UPI0039F11A1A